MCVSNPYPVILSPCAKAGVIIVVPVADAIAAAATKNIASIFPFIFDFIDAIKTTHCIIVLLFIIVR